MLFAAGCVFAQVEEITLPLKINYLQTTIRTRFSPPKGYTWMPEIPGDFGYFLVNFPLHPSGFPLRDFRLNLADKQFFHAALLNVDVGEKDLQQCADAWMRLYAEYLWLEKRQDEITFEFTSGQKMSWIDYRSGIRTTENGAFVKFKKTAPQDDSYANFRNYLDLIFKYSGTISLDRESNAITRNEDIKTGDFLIKPGSPGHCVIIVGRAINAKGKMIFLLAQGFMPAQDVHIINNPWNKSISPWYELDVHAPKTQTAKYVFEPTSIKRFKDIK